MRISKMHIFVALSVLFIFHHSFAATAPKVSTSDIPASSLRLEKTQSFATIKQRCQFVPQEHSATAPNNPDSKNTTCMIAWSPDGARLATITPDPDWKRLGRESLENQKTGEKDSTGSFHSLVEVWDREFKHSILLKKFSGGDSETRPNPISWSADGTQIALTEQNRVFRFDTLSGEPLDWAGSPNAEIVSFAPQNDLIASVRENRVRILDKNQKLLKSWNYAGDASQIYWSPDGKKIALLSRIHGESTRSRIYVDSLDGNHPPRSFEVPDETTQFAWSPDGKQIATTEIEVGGLKVWNLQTGKRAWSEENIEKVPWIHVHSLLWSKDGKFLVAAASYDRRFFVYDAKKHKSLEVLKLTSPLVSAAFLPDQRLVLIDQEGMVSFYKIRNMLSTLPHKSPQG